MTHELKTWPQYLSRILSGEKHFELRKNDRDFQTGDTLVLREWDDAKKEYTGVGYKCNVTYVLHGPMFGLQEGFCIMSIEIPKPF